MPAIDQKSNAEEVINVSKDQVRFELEGIRYMMSPGERITIHRSYALPRRFKKDKDAIPSVVNLLTGGRVVHIRSNRAQKFLSSEE